LSKRYRVSTVRAQRVADFIEQFLVVPEGKDVGKPVVLRDWQLEFIDKVYSTPTRRAILSMGRKNGKSALSAMMLLAHLAGPEALPNSQIYSAAQSRDQASLVFGLAAKMVRLSPDLNAIVHVRDSAKILFCHAHGTTYRALSADATTAYGLSPVFAIHDELGQVIGPRSELYDAIETAMGAREDPLSVIISTQAPSDADLLSTLIDDAKTGADPKIKLFLHASDLEDDIHAEETWRKANPAIGDFRSKEDLREAAENARRLPSFESSFRNLFLNQRVAAKNNLVSRTVWELNAGEPDPTVFTERAVYAGLDLSSRQDLTALVLVARDDQRVWHVQCHFWTPEGGLGGVRRVSATSRGVVVTPWPGTGIRDGAMSGGTHLRLEERARLAVLKAEGLSLRAIAARLGRAASTSTRSVTPSCRRSSSPTT
jgi:phage terminase large subunit-like protein